MEGINSENTSIMYRLKDKDMKEGTPGGIKILNGLFLIFMALKLAKIVDWSWWWVTSPLWIGAGLLLVMFILLWISSPKK
jgi:hypothetical protein